MLWNCRNTIACFSRLYLEKNKDTHVSQQRPILACILAGNSGKTADKASFLFRCHGQIFWLYYEKLCFIQSVTLIRGFAVSLLHQYNPQFPHNSFVSLESALWMFSLRFKAAATANSSQAVFFSLNVDCQYNQTWSFLTFTYNLALLWTVPHTPHTHTQRAQGQLLQGRHLAVIRY